MQSAEHRRTGARPSARGRRARRRDPVADRNREAQRSRPEAYLRDVLTRIADHPINRIGELLPWYMAQPETNPDRKLTFRRSQQDGPSSWGLRTRSGAQ
ncbi:transposase domain-containing protein [Ensifer aridi]|uniref:transposase domain-containing protein n=1 Tax=Ensifer aridi TaxID=1708715 RepID=UPI003B968AD9